MTEPSTLTQAPATAAATVAAVNSYDEFTRLREVIIGTAVGAALPSPEDPSAWLNLYPDLRRDELAGAPSGPVDARVVEETEEDLAGLCAALELADVVVRRPAPADHSVAFDGPGWRSHGMYSYCPRDLTLVLGDTLIETPSPTRARWHENRSLHALFAEYHHGGGRWLSAPEPQLADDLYGVDASGLPFLAESEPAFEAANVLRVGRDLLYQVSGSGNEAGLRWLRSTVEHLGSFHIEPLRGVYAGTHIDSTIALLRPGLVLLNPARLDASTAPALFAGWDVVWCPAPPADPATGPFTLSSPWLSMNLLMIDTDLAVVDADHPSLLRVLERRGITVIPIRLRHARTLGGGFHCVSLDVRRDGGLEDYR